MTEVTASDVEIPSSEDKSNNNTDEIEKLKAIADEVQEFEESCAIACEAVKQKAEELIERIRDHEERLLEEVEMRKTTEYKKLRIDPENIKDVGSNPLINFNCIQFRRIADLIQSSGTPDSPGSPGSPRSSLPGLPHSLPACSSLPTLPQPDFILPRLTFTSVRCNTAFGVVDTESNITNGADGTPVNKKRSISVSSLPLSGIAGMSPALRHRQQKRSVHRLASDSEAASGCPPTPPQLNHRRNKLSTSSVNEEPVEGNKIIRRKYHSMREKDFVRLASPRFNSSIRQRYSRASSNENFLGCKLLWQLTEEGDGLDQLRCPTDIKFLQDGRCIIADRDNERICIYSNKGACLKVIAKGKVKPRRLAITKDGRIATTDSKENVIKIYDTKGQQVGSWGKKIFKNLFKSPCGIAVMSNGNFVVSDLERHTVGIYTSEGKFLSYLGYTPGKESPNKGSPEFHSPSYLHVDTRDNIIISDSWNHSVKVYTPEGKLSFQFNKLDEGGGDLKYPNGVTTDGRGNILIADWGGHTVSMFQSNGSFRRHLVRRTDLLHHPAGISAAGNRLAVTEYSENHSSVRVYEIPEEQKITGTN